MFPLDRRKFLRIFGVTCGCPTLSFALSRPASAAELERSSKAVDVTAFRRPLDREDTWAFLRAFAVSRKVHAPKGQGLASDGSYLVSGLTMPPETQVYGDGPMTVFRPASLNRPTCFVVQSDKGAPSVSGLTIRDLTLVGHSVEQGFSEHRHLISFNGVERVHLANLHLRGFQGDGVYFGTGLDGQGGRKNRDIRIENCVFDGLNHQNRNAISIIDGVGVRILSCSFVRCTRDDMPGAIDFEPNAPGREQVGMIVIRNCAFTGCGGMAGQIALIVPNAEASFVGTAVIEDNVFSGSIGSGPDIQIDVQPPTKRAAVPLHEILVRRNVGNSGNRPMHCKAAAVLTCLGNKWVAYKEGSIIGTARGPTVQRITINDHYENVGQVVRNGAALDVRDLDYALVEGSTFVGCGQVGAAVINFFDGRTRRFEVTNSSFIATDQSARAIANITSGYDLTSVKPVTWLDRRKSNRFVGFTELLRDGKVKTRM